jgi:hypothetical protein
MSRRAILRLFHVPAPLTGRAPAALAARLMLATTNAKRG